MSGSITTEEELVRLARGDIPTRHVVPVGVSLNPTGTEALVILSLDGARTWLDVSHLRKNNGWDLGISFPDEEGRGMSSLDGTRGVTYVTAKAPPEATAVVVETAKGEFVKIQPSAEGFAFYALWDQPFPSDSPFPRVVGHHAPST